jgi:predicted PurR-regulated permease PerM
MSSRPPATGPLTARGLLRVGLLVLALVVAWIILTKLSELLLVFLIAIVLAEGLRPLVDRVAGFGLHWELARIVVYVVLIAVLVALIAILARPVVAEARLVLANLPEYRDEVNRNLEQLLGQFSINVDVSSEIRSYFGAFAKTAFDVVRDIVRAGFDVVVVLLMSFLWLSASRPLAGFIVGLLPEGRRPLATSVWEDIAGRFAGYVRGVAVNMVVIGILVWIAATVVGLPAAILLAVWSGLTEMIPYVGPVAGAIPGVVLAFTISPGLAVVMAIIYLVIQEVEAHTLVPLVMRQAVGLPALAVVLALAAGATLGGVGGALVAVPAASALQVLVVRWIAPEIRAQHQRRRPAS